MRSTLLALVLLAGCAGSADPGNGTTAEELKTSLVGSYENDDAAWRAGDLVTLALLADGRFARIRCLDDGCATWVPEDGHWLVAGKRLSFYLGAGNQTGAFTPDPATLLDVWSFRAARATLTLTRADRSPLRLDAVADADLCDRSGGTFSAGQCDCGTGWLFIAGEGGCTEAPVPSESACDDTHGSWCDDDDNLLGTYCECPRDQLWQDGVGCTTP